MKAWLQKGLEGLVGIWSVFVLVLQNKTSLCLLSDHILFIKESSVGNLVVGDICWMMRMIKHLMKQLMFLWKLRILNEGTLAQHPGCTVDMDTKGPVCTLDSNPPSACREKVNPAPTTSFLGDVYRYQDC